MGSGLRRYAGLYLNYRIDMRTKLERFKENKVNRNMSSRFEMEEVVSKRGPGGGGGDDSDALEDMKFAEKLVLDREFIEALGTLDILTDANRNHGYKFVTVKIDVLKSPELGYEAGDMSSAAQRINAVFVAIGRAHPRAAYRAQPYNSENAPTKEIISDEGVKTERVLSDKIKIFRTGEVYDGTKYGVEESGKKWKKTGEPLDYESPTSGVTVRVARWIFENGEANKEIFNAAGIDVTTEETVESTV